MNRRKHIKNQHFFSIGEVAIAFLILLFVAPASAYQSDWVNSNNASFNGVKIETRMYIPAGQEVSRGIIISAPGYGGDQRGFATRKRTKDAATAWGFAAMGLKFPTGSSKYITARLGSGQALLNAIAAHATKSGHPELVNAPLVMLGFSHGGAFTYSFTLWRPSKVIAFACNKSGYATTEQTSPAARAVPGMFFFGEFDAASVRPRMTKIVSTNRARGALWGLAEDWGARHQQGDAVNLIFPFFEEVIGLRYPGYGSPLNGQVGLRGLSQASGFLGDNGTFTRNPAIISKYGSYSRTKAQASWLPDFRIAQKWRDCVTKARTCEYEKPGT